MEKTVERGPDWVGMPIIATIAQLLCRDRHCRWAQNTGYARSR